MSRNLQALISGGTTEYQFIELVIWEAESIGDIQIPKMSFDDVEQMKEDFENLCTRWNMLTENESLLLTF